MKRPNLWVALAALCAAGPAIAQDFRPIHQGVPAYQPQQAAPVMRDPGPTTTGSTSGRGSALGGGFIEFLMTGGKQPGPQAARVQTMNQSASPQPVVMSSAPSGGVPMYPGASYQGAAYSGGVDPAGARTTPVRTAHNGAPATAQLEPSLTPRGMDPRFLPQTVSYSTRHAPGTLVIDTTAKYLYLVEGGGQARRYGIGVGRPGFEWRGEKRITRKSEWPDWRPPAEMLLRRPDLPRFMAGGPQNPLGARALYLGSSLYRIHGSNEPHTIGQAVSSGCFRMRNEDVMDLYDRVRVGTRVIVM
ncbi:MAG: L,D-transpeptidase [Alphaproteobacteria bacterium]